MCQRLETGDLPLILFLCKLILIFVASGDCFATLLLTIDLECQFHVSNFTVIRTANTQKCTFIINTIHKGLLNPQKAVPFLLIAGCQSFVSFGSINSNLLDLMNSFSN